MLAAKSVYRATAQAVKMLINATVNHTQVGTVLVHREKLDTYLGGFCVDTQKKKLYYQTDKLRCLMRKGETDEICNCIRSGYRGAQSCI